MAPAVLPFLAQFETAASSLLMNAMILGGFDILERK